MEELLFLKLFIGVFSVIALIAIVVVCAILYGVSKVLRRFSAEEQLERIV